MSFGFRHLNTARFSNLVHLALFIGSNALSLTGGLFPTLKTLALYGMGDKAIIDFTGVDRPLDVLLLKYCRGKVIMPVPPISLATDYLLHKGKVEALLYEVKQLTILASSPCESFSWPRLFYTARIAPVAAVAANLRGMKVENLTVSSSQKGNIFIILYIQMNELLTQLRCDNLAVVISGGNLVNLRSLHVTGGQTQLEGQFEILDMLTLDYTHLKLT